MFGTGRKPGLPLMGTISEVFLESMAHKHAKRKKVSGSMGQERWLSSLDHVLLPFWRA